MELEECKVKGGETQTDRATWDWYSLAKVGEGRDTDRQAHKGLFKYLSNAG